MNITPAHVLLFGGIGMLSAGFGFIAGTWYGRAEFDRSLNRAKRSLTAVVDMLLVAIERAQKAASSLERCENATLAADQAERIERGQGRLVATLTNAVQSLGRPSASVGRTRKPKPFRINWQRGPTCDRTGLPTRASFEANLANLLEASDRSAASFGVMFVSIDRFDRLRTRFGAVTTDAFLGTTGRMIGHGVRDKDLVCRYDDDTIAVLLPEVDAAGTAEIAHTVRDTLRAHRFHIEADGPEVLVTTSLGMALCHPGENLPVLLGRADEALRASRRRGRNQAHVHDGQSMNRCAGLRA